MNLLYWILLGALAGWLASIIMKTNEQQGWVANIVVGIVGAILGGWITGLLLGRGVDGINLWSLLVAIGGACLAIAIWRAVSNRNRSV